MVDDNATDGNTSDDFCVVPSATPGDCQTFPSGDPSCPFALPGETTYECTRTIVPVVVGGVSTTYTNNVTISAEGPDPETCPATLVVHPNPVVTINSFACTFAPAFELCASPSGGTPDYAYSWAPTGDITQCTGLETATGSYTVTVTDANGCFDDATRNVGYCSD